MLKIGEAPISSEPFPELAAVSLADVTDINLRKSRTWAQNGARTVFSHSRWPKPPPSSILHALPMNAKTISGFVNSPRTRPVAPTLLQARVGHGRQSSPSEVCLDLPPGRGNHFVGHPASACTPPRTGSSLSHTQPGHAHRRGIQTSQPSPPYSPRPVLYHSKSCLVSCPRVGPTGDKAHPLTPSTSRHSTGPFFISGTASEAAFIAQE